MHICAECLDFMPCGDWDLCCRQQVRRLAYESSEACDRIRPGREISPLVVVTEDDGRYAHRLENNTLERCIEYAKRLKSEGHEMVYVVDDKPDQLYPLLWMEGEKNGGTDD